MEQETHGAEGLGDLNGGEGSYIIGLAEPSGETARQAISTSEIRNAKATKSYIITGTSPEPLTHAGVRGPTLFEMPQKMLV